MKVKVTIEKTTFEDRIIDMDERFRACAGSWEEINDIPTQLFEEAANEAAKIIGVPLAGEEELDDLEVIVARECVDNGELIFEL